MVQGIFVWLKLNGINYENLAKKNGKKVYYNNEKVMLNIAKSELGQSAFEKCGGKFQHFKNAGCTM